MSRTINWGVLGTASIAKGQVIPGMMKAENANLYAIAGRNSNKVKAFKEEFGFEKGYDSLDELLEDEDVDAVYIPLPNNLHREWILKAAEKKKHILCEKPLVPSPEEAEEVVAFCRKQGVILAEAFAYLHNPMTREIINIVREGQIGTPVLIEAHFFSKKWPEDNIRLRKDLYGGCTYDLACYNISMILQLMGEMPCQIDAMAHFLESGVDDYSNLFLKFPSGAYASATCGMCSSERATRLYVHGSEGTVETEIAYNGEGELSYYLTKGKERNLHKVQVPSNYMLEIEQFGRCVLGEEAEPLVSNAFTLQVARIVQEALKKIGYESF
ncbi:MAG: Gfo/Idh/MocA family oxidoreductase [Eubacteriales bacterium]|nr:Gfo/Idh/MocA family oxidoreductase [Eubacteriales bacterium]